MRRLAIYSRTSTDHQGKGLEAQQRALRDYLTYRKVTDYLEFSDDGVSGTKRSRPGFDKLMAAVRADKVDMVLVYSYSRFARNTMHLLDSLAEFEKRKVAFISLSENIDTTTPGGRLVFTIMAGIAQFEREQIVERVKNGLRNAVAKGKVLGTPKRVPDAEIVEMAAKGAKPAAIVKTLGVSRASVYRALKAA